MSKVKQVLVVEDELIVGRDICNMLELIGYGVSDYVPSGEKALECIVSKRPDIAIVDIKLRGLMDGIELAANLQNFERIPVVFLSAYADLKTLARAKSVSPCGYLLKPINKNELRTELEMAFARHNTLNLLKNRSKEAMEALQNLDEGVLAADINGIVNFLNLKGEKLSGWSRIQAVGKKFEEIFILEKNDSSGIFLKRKNKTLLPIVDRTLLIKDKEGNQSGSIIVFSENKTNEQKVDANEKKSLKKNQQQNIINNLAALFPSLENKSIFTNIEKTTKRNDTFKSIKLSFLVINDGWEIIDANKSAVELFGLNFSPEKKQIYPNKFTKLLSTNNRKSHYNEILKSLRSKNEISLLLKEKIAGKNLLLKTFAHHDGLCMVFIDVSDLKINEPEQKLNVLGAFAGSFAHQFNNLLTILLGNLSLAEVQISEDASYREEVNNALEVTHKAQELVQQLQTFAIGSSPLKNEFIIDKLLEKFLKQRKIQKNLSYSLKKSQENIKINADSKQFLLLFENILKNSEQAIQPTNQNGQIDIEIDLISQKDLKNNCNNNSKNNYEDYQAFINKLKDNKDEFFVELKIQDNGDGISQDNLEYCFSPFFTSREKSHASGLGLTICKIITQAHNGLISINSQIKKGTQITLLLPANCKKTQKKPQKTQFFGKKNQAQSKPREYSRIDKIIKETSRIEQRGQGEKSFANMESKTKKVLILEDEIMIRKVMSAALKKAGYETHEAEEGQKAIELYKKALEEKNPYALYISDLHIPYGLNGKQAFAKILELDPDVTAIVSSGYDDDPVMADYKNYGFKAALPKPYQPRELLDLVKKLLPEKSAELIKT